VLTITNEHLEQGWGTYLLSRAAWIMQYRWRNAESNNFILKLYPVRLINYEDERLPLLYCLSTCLSWSFVTTWSYTLTWLTKILMPAISNVHAGRRFATPGLEYDNIDGNCTSRAEVTCPRKI